MKPNDIIGEDIYLIDTPGLRNEDSVILTVEELDIYILGNKL